jgi:hypothetical protein
MYKELISSILVVALLNLLGCYSFKPVNPAEYKQVEGEDNFIVITKHSNKFYFSDFYFYKDTLRGKASPHSMGKRMDKKIAISDIKSIESEYFDRGKTSLLTLGVVVIVTIILAIIFTSKKGWY